MSRVTLTVLGDPRIAAALGSDRSLEGIGILTTALAKELVPYDKGPLRNSLMYKTKMAQGGFNESAGQAAPEDARLRQPVAKNSGIVGSGMFYAVYQEKGTVKMIAQPFLTPAVYRVVQNRSAIKVVEEFSTEAMEIEFAKRKRKVLFNQETPT